MNAIVAEFESLPIWLSAVVVVGGFTLISILLGRLTQRVVRTEMLVEHNELTGFTFAVVGVIYAVLLGFVAIGVWERFGAAEQNTYVEAAGLTSVYRDAAFFPQGGHVRSDLRAYVRDIVEKAWPAMEQGRDSAVNDAEEERIARDVAALSPRDAREGNIHQHMLAAMSTAVAARDQRLTEDSTGLNGIMWTVVILGGFITVGFSFLFGFKDSAMQTAMIGTLALLIGLVIFLAMSLDYPFRGAVSIRPEAFERALTTFHTMDAQR